MHHKMIGNKGDCVRAYDFIKNHFNEEIKENDVLTGMKKVVLELKFDIAIAQKILKEERHTVTFIYKA